MCMMNEPRICQECYDKVKAENAALSAMLMVAEDALKKYEETFWQHHHGAILKLAALRKEMP